MNNEDLESKWDRIKDQVRQKYGIMVDDNQFEETKMNEAIKRIQEKTGRTKKQIEREIDTWEDNN